MASQWRSNSGRSRNPLFLRHITRRYKKLINLGSCPLTAFFAMKSRPGVPPLDNHEWKTNVLLRKRGKALFIGGGWRGKHSGRKRQMFLHLHLFLPIIYPSHTASEKKFAVSQNPKTAFSSFLVLSFPQLLSADRTCSVELCVNSELLY